jgi:hypothetical protein
MFTNEAISAVLGTRSLSSDRHRNLDRLATSTAAAHWHLSNLPWEELPLFPMPDNVKGRRLRVFVELGKRAIRTQLAAEHVAVAAARHLLLRAEDGGMHMSLRRALAAVLNDEASHVLVMTEMDVRAEAEFPEFPLNEPKSPLLPLFREAVPPLHPALVSLFMGTYEAMIAIRGYAEQAAYARPSILGKMAGHAAEDDGRHAKVMRLAAHEWLDRLRAQLAEERAEDKMREIILDPIRLIWPLVMQHEYWLLQNDAGQRETFYRRAKEDISLADHLLRLLEFSDSERSYLNLDAVELLEARSSREEALAS